MPSILKVICLTALLSGLYSHAGPIACVFAAALLQSATGFGLVMIAAPLLMYFYDPKLVIPLVVLIAATGNTTQTMILRRDAVHDIVKWLIAGSVLGQPVGFFIYNNVSGTVLKLIVSGLILFSLTLMRLLHLKIEIRPRNTAVCGFIAGITTTTTGMGGPVLILYFSGSPLTPTRIRATSITYFFLGNVMSIATFLIGGIDLIPAFAEYIWLLPGLAAGIFAGQTLFNKIPAPLFRKALYVVLIATCLHTVFDTLIKM